MIPMARAQLGMAGSPKLLALSPLLQTEVIGISWSTIRIE
jgi:hypothetical protein